MGQMIDMGKLAEGAKVYSGMMDGPTYNIGAAYASNRSGYTGEGMPVSSPTPEPPAPETDVEEEKALIENVVQGGTIQQLLDALRMMATMQPGQGGNPVFQLDAMYKESSALGGIPGTPAQYPSAGGVTRETEFYM